MSNTLSLERMDSDDCEECERLFRCSIQNYTIGRRIIIVFPPMIEDYFKTTAIHCEGDCDLTADATKYL